MVLVSLPSLRSAAARGAFVALAIATAAAAPGVVGRARAQETNTPTEYEVKAAYLYNFARFVQWPPDAFSSPTAPFVLAVLGEDPFGSTLDSTCEGKRLSDRPIVIRRIRRAEDLDGAHMVFISASQMREMSHIAQSLANRSILSVGDLSGMAREGAVIGFRVENERVRFDINLSRAEQSRLKVSSQLLKVAMTVNGEPPGR